jgi:hypothetical protein
MAEISMAEISMAEIKIDDYPTAHNHLILWCRQARWE